MSKPEPVKYVILDLDGTILDTGELHCVMDGLALSSRAGKVSTHTVWTACMCRPAGPAGR